MDLNVNFNRDAGFGNHSFREVFVGFDSAAAVRAIFGSETDEILSHLTVEIQDTGGYLHIDDELGRIVVDKTYLKEADIDYLYLDAIHELIHIRQLREGLDLFDRRYSYVDRPTELEAYRETVREARRIGLAEDAIVEYLRVEWVAEDDFGRFLMSLGVQR
jgi:hypothetical protein